MRIVCISNEKNSAVVTTLIAGLADAFGDSGHRVLSLDPDPSVPLVRKGALLPNLGHSLMSAFTEEHIPYDHVLFHCPASFRGLAMSALAAADLALLAAPIDAAARDAMEVTLRTVAMIERSRGQVLPVLIVPTHERGEDLMLPHGCRRCIAWDEAMSSATTPLFARRALERLASWLISEGTAAPLATAAGRVAA
jgi:cellulose biosynthesis protein BcsQ